MALRSLLPLGRSRSPAVGGESTNPLMAFHEQMNRLFDEFSRDLNMPGLGLSADFGFPHVELSESEKEVKVEAELPGLSEGDIELTVKDGALLIRGEKKSAVEDKSRRVSERFYGRFERLIPLPGDVREDQANATFKNGVLTVTLPKSQEAVQKSKRIPIKAQ
ncbi:MAG TPA: Hsp20/alpha crystallin family protein [Steroidobacteraceae bacterium]|nr:Hsp20/alpha crystallin family protein [Steroidobacteraceae bacterium]